MPLNASSQIQIPLNKKREVLKYIYFLAVTWQLYRFPCHSLTDSLTHSLTDSLTHCHFWKTLPKSTLRDLWPLRHVIRVMRRHDLTNKKTMTKTNTKTKTMTMTMTFGEHPQRATPETFDIWDIWSEWWGDMTWQTNRQIQRQIQRQRQWQWQWQWHLENTLKEQPQRLVVTFGTFKTSKWSNYLSLGCSSPPKSRTLVPTPTEWISHNLCFSLWESTNSFIH